MNKKIGKALVVGAGISGMRAALDLAETGYGVTLIDRSPHMGGLLMQLDQQFPSNRCGMCKMLPLVERDAGSQFCMRKGLFHENIDIRLSTELIGLEGEPGRFQVSLRQAASGVDPRRCVGCGECVKVCPVEVPDAFNAGLNQRKAIYLPTPHGIPNTYIIDPEVCTRCGACEPVCPTDAIQLSAMNAKDFRVLVVDDELIVRDSIKEWLVDEGFQVDMVPSGPAALNLLQEQTYQMMLLDIKMPEMDGVEVLKQALILDPELLIVMMTAYATVETAVDAMKSGALDYLIKPFDPETLTSKVLKIYQDSEATKGEELEVGAIVLCGGTDFYDPASEKNPFGYGVLPNILTGLEFERLLSGTGPCGGRLVAPADGAPIHKIAWIQCVGSRDLQSGADYCSSACCMYVIKQAALVKEKAGPGVETTIFYMDLRTFGKSFQRYRDHAESELGIRFVRARVHSIATETSHHKLQLRYLDPGGGLRTDAVDMVVLPTGQRPSDSTRSLAESLDLPLNDWGFVQTEPYSLTRTSRNGITIGGSCSGFKDIREAVIQAGAASLEAARVIHAAGGSMAPEPEPSAPYRDVSRESPRLHIFLCHCDSRLPAQIDSNLLQKKLEADPAISRMAIIDPICTAQGWQDFLEQIAESSANRLLVGSCLPHLYGRKLMELRKAAKLTPQFIETVDILRPLQADLSENLTYRTEKVVSVIEMAASKLKQAEPDQRAAIEIQQSAVVVGGGIAGMCAALAIADLGYPVSLVEKKDRLGGNLNWLRTTLDDALPETLYQETVARIEKHPLIHLRLDSKVIGSFGQVGHFITTIENVEQQIETIEHGVTILATGGSEAQTDAYHYGAHPAVVTQKELEAILFTDPQKAAQQAAVVMIQCVGSREEPRNFCSRICCSTAIKHALHLKKLNPDMAIYVLYRDIMTYGFYETYFTQAREAGVIFIPYEKTHKPQLTLLDDTASADPALQVHVSEPIVGRDVTIAADLVVLATGIMPQLSEELATVFGVKRDADGFFQEAESKWRPVDALKEGVFACGLSLAPGNLAEAIASGEAAAHRALRILNQKQMFASRTTAYVRHSLCSRCELCIDACPYGARAMDLDHEKMWVNPAMCQGCGTCAAVCPNSASVITGFKDAQMLDQIDGVLPHLATGESH